MVGKKLSRGPVSQISSGAVRDAHASGILRSSFCPSEYQLDLFASVIQGFESQHVRIHNVIHGRLHLDHAIGSRASVTCLDWGLYDSGVTNGNEENPKKRRKRNSGVDDLLSAEKKNDVVLAIGTSDAKIEILSCASSNVVNTLVGVHTQAIKDFKFASRRSHAQGWSLGSDGKLVQWDVPGEDALRTISLPDTAISALASPRFENTKIFCASYNGYIIDAENSTAESLFTVTKEPAHTLIRASASSKVLLAAADADAVAGIFDVDAKKRIRSLKAESGIAKLSAHDVDEAVDAFAIVTVDGTVELFLHPFTLDSASSASHSKKGKKQMVQKANAIVKIVQSSNKSDLFPILDVDFSGNDLIIAWVERAVQLRFERVQWRDSAGEIKLNGVHELSREKTAIINNVNGVKDMGKLQVDDSQAVVTTGLVNGNIPTNVLDAKAIDMSSDAEDSSSDEDDDENASTTSSQPDKEETSTPPTSAKDVDMKDASSDEEDPNEEPTFGDQLRATAPAIINVASVFKPETTALVPNAVSGTISPSAIPTGLSLGTVLTQSLKTNDDVTLETCFHVTDFDIVRATIQRLDSRLAATLLTKLAQRLHRRPGRAGKIMVWIQWTIVAHGGYLANQRDLMRKIRLLFPLIDQRSANLSSLLQLKGKLDMLEAQMSLRKDLAATTRAADEEDDEERVIYVEGQESEDVPAIATTAIPMVTDASTASAIATVKTAESKAIEQKRSINHYPPSPNSDDEGASADDEADLSDEAIEPDDESSDEASEGGFFDEEAEETDDDSDEDFGEVEYHTDDADEDSDAESQSHDRKKSKISR